MNIKICSVTKKYKSSFESCEALKEVNLSFNATGFVCILGKNGSGKTTLLNCLGLLDEKFSGDILFDGVSSSSFSDEKRRTYRKNLFAYIFQTNNLINDINVRDNVCIEQIIEGDEPFLKNWDEGFSSLKKPSQLSGGQRQLTAINRALKSEKPIFICDEPTASLDEKNSFLILEKLKEISKTKLVLLVTHEKEIVEKYADRVIELKSGKVIKDEVLNRTQSLTCSNADDFKNPKLSFAGFLKLITSSFKQKKGSLSFTMMLNIIFLTFISIISSFLTFDSIAALSTNLPDTHVVTPFMDASIKYNAEKSDRTISISDSIIQNVEECIPADAYAFSISDYYGHVTFHKNSNIPIGKAIIGDETLQQLLHISPSQLPVTKLFSNERNNMTYELEIIDVFEGKGIKTDFLTYTLPMNSTVFVNNGIWRNTRMDASNSPVSAYVHSPVEYISASYYNSFVKEEDKIIFADADQAIISEELFSYLDYNPLESQPLIRNFIDLRQFEGDDALYGYANLAMIYPSGIKIISIDNEIPGQYARFSRYIIVSDSKYEEILGEISPFQSVCIWKEGLETNVSKLFLENGYRFKSDLSNSDVISNVISLHNTICALHGTLIVIMLVLVFGVIVSLLLFANIIYKNDGNKIAILKCFGLSNSSAQLPSKIELMLSALISGVTTFILAPLLCFALNSSLSQTGFAFGFKVFIFSWSQCFILLSAISLAISSALLLLTIKNKNKDVRYFFTNND